MSRRGARGTNPSERDRPSRHPEGGKFGVYKDPLEIEASISNMRPRPMEKDEKKRLVEITNQLLRNPQLSQGEKRALEIYKVGLLTAGFNQTVLEEWQRDFWRWLLGRGTEEDTKKTPWGRRSLAYDPEVSSYIDQWVVKRENYRMKLQLLKMRVPIGINQAYLYFKYIVRGEDLDRVNFLSDWAIMVQEFQDGRDAGDDWREPARLPHETAPYGGGEDDAKGSRDAISKDFYKKDKAKDRFDSDWTQAPDEAGRDGGAPHDPEDDQPPTGPPSTPPRGGGPTPSFEERALNPGDMENFAKTIAQELTRIGQSASSPEARIVETEQQLAVVRENAARMEGELSELRKQLEISKTARQPTDENAAAIERQEKALARIEGLTQQGLELQRNIAEEGLREREFRQKMFEEFMKEATKGRESSNLPELQQLVADFRKYAQISEQRMMAIESNLTGNVGESGPQIEQLDSISSSMKQAADILRLTGQNLLQLTAAADADRQSMRAEALAIVAANRDNQAKVLEHFNSRVEMDRKFYQRMMQGFEASFKEMFRLQNNGEFAKALEKQNEAIRHLLQQMPAQQEQLLLEWKRRTEEATAEQTRALIALKDQSSGQLREALALVQQEHQVAQQQTNTMQFMLQESAHMRAYIEQLGNAGAKLLNRNEELERLATTQREENLRMQEQIRIGQEQLQSLQQRAANMINALEMDRVQARQSEQRAQIAARNAERSREAMKAAAVNLIDRAMQEVERMRNAQEATPIIEEGEDVAEPMEIDEEDMTQNEQWLLEWKEEPAPLPDKGKEEEGELKPAEYSAEELQNLSPQAKRVLELVRQLENGIIQNQAILDGLSSEERHLFQVKSLRPKVLERKLIIYKHAIQRVLGPQNFGF